MSHLDPGPGLAELVGYALNCGLITATDEDWALNSAMAILGLDAPGSYSGPQHGSAGPEAALAPLLSLAVASGRLTDSRGSREQLAAALLGSLMDRPSQVNREFWQHFELNPIAATDYFFELCVAANYIHADQSRRNPRWRHPCRYGEVEMTINLVKPEKDPRDIAAMAGVLTTGYPTCLLCRENEGYAGRVDHPARQNLRLITLDLADERWLLQYSPYLYYPEHCIVLAANHEPMRLTRATFDRLFAFVAQFPHYFLGSNADLPIVGGSILNHDHFQGGRHHFPMEFAASVGAFNHPDGLTGEVLDWPLTSIRLRHPDPVLVAAAGHALLAAWRDHDEPETGVVANSAGAPHNTVTPIVRFAHGSYELDVVLRNNRTSRDHPFGIFHPHAEVHPVKRENIGLIEVMGLAVLPGRLAKEMTQLSQVLAAGEPLPANLAPFDPMLASLRGRSGDPESLVREAVGDLFVRGLEHCGVFSSGAAGLIQWERLLRPLGWRRTG